MFVIIEIWFLNIVIIIPSYFLTKNLALFYNSTAGTTSVVQVPASRTTPYQESVITNTESVDTKQTKKRKAVSGANNSNNIAVDFAATPPPQVTNLFTPNTSI